MNDAKIYDVVNIEEREGKSTKITTKIDGKTMYFLDKDKKISEKGKWKIEYEQYKPKDSEYTFNMVKDAELMVSGDIIEFKNGKEYKPESPDRDCKIGRMAALNTAVEILKLQNQNKLIEKNNIIDEVIDIAEMLEKWVGR